MNTSWIWLSPLTSATADVPHDARRRSTPASKALVEKWDTDSDSSDGSDDELDLAV